ncbi:MAG: DUF982 domain-containing protein [Rhizobiaceae bacterium]
MDATHFVVPVRVAMAADEHILEIYSAEDALYFLQKWPGKQSGPIYQGAFDACFGALSGLNHPEEARRAFIRFAKVENIISPDMALAPDERRAAVRPQ